MSDEQVVETPVEGQAPPETPGGTGDKPAESPKQASFPKSFEEMSEEQKALYLLGAKHHKAYIEEEAAKAPKETPRRATADDDPTVQVEKIIDKMIGEALSETGGAELKPEARKLLTKTMSKVLAAQHNMTQKMAEEIAEKKVAGLRTAIVDTKAQEFFDEYKWLDKSKDKIRTMIEKYGVPVDVVMDAFEPHKPKAKTEDDEPYERPEKARTIDDIFMETPSRTGETAPATSAASKAKAAFNAALKAQKEGNTAERDKNLRAVMRYNRTRAA